MKATLLTVAAVLLAGAAHAQAAPQTPPTDRSASDLTRDLNSGPPTIEEYLARPITPAPAPAPAPATTGPAATPRSAPPPAAAPVRPAPIPAVPSAAPRADPIRPANPATPPPLAAPTRPAVTPAPTPATSRPAPVPARPVTPPPEAPAAAASAPMAPAAPAVTVLDVAARAALPFTVELPQGFEIVTGRPGPDFRIYTIRRGERSFAMVYVGPASQFPIYSGEVIEAAGRASVVSTEGGVRHAREHLFQRPEGTTPHEIHVWTMSLEGADRALAERIAQAVDVR